MTMQAESQSHPLVLGGDLSAVLATTSFFPIDAPLPMRYWEIDAIFMTTKGNVPATAVMSAQLENASGVFEVYAQFIWQNAETSPNLQQVNFAQPLIIHSSLRWRTRLDNAGAAVPINWRFQGRELAR